MKVSQIKLGDRLRVKEPVKAYYSNYGGKPEMILTPDIVGVAGAVKVPFVTRHNGYFVCVDFYYEATKQIERAGVNYENLVRA
jgi:hypothetical protein